MKESITFRYALNTIKHFFEDNKQHKGSIGQNLQLYTAIFAENKRHITVPVVLFGGTGQELRNISTPDLNNTLPKIYEFWVKITGLNTDAPLFIVGHSFDEVFERKIRLLCPCIPDIRMLQYINIHRFRNASTSTENRANKLVMKYEIVKQKRNIENEEDDFMAAMYNYINNEGKIGDKNYRILDWEVQAGEGTTRAEKIDFLALERSKRWLTVIELKFTDLIDIRLQGSIFQGMDYCNWVEKHKYEIAMIYNNKKWKIDTRRRSRLILINGPDGFPSYYSRIVTCCKKIDRYQEIELYSLSDEVLPIKLNRIL